jgi:RNA:NAD 2'-phosphotransferase (TPT1/KptA family)
MALTEPQARHRRTQGVGDEISDSSYQKIKKAVQEGAVKPSVAQLKKLARGTEKAYQAIDRMLVEEVIQQKKNGRYAIS